ncbi:MULTISPECIES: hypothetical protein [unclassified Microcoleus]|uniref:hypothetical protein n=1 Tax=unclassified Microcoleus TaxID=2642155 RepID=UPI002FD0A156
MGWASSLDGLEAHPTIYLELLRWYTSNFDNPIDWFLGSAWEPISRGSASRGEWEIGGRACGSALPGRAWERVI